MEILFLTASPSIENDLRLQSKYYFRGGEFRQIYEFVCHSELKQFLFFWISFSFFLDIDIIAKHIQYFYFGSYFISNDRTLHISKRAFNKVSLFIIESADKKETTHPVIVLMTGGS